MTSYIALLRAVNVGGTGPLPMQRLRAICDEAGFTKVQTYIASGNVVFEAEASPSEVTTALEMRLEREMGKPLGVHLRTAQELAAVLATNPFPDANPSRTVVIFIESAPPPDALDKASGQSTEEIRLGRREFYVHYPDGQGRSKLKIPAAKAGTARNLNTVAKLVELAGGG